MSDSNSSTAPSPLERLKASIISYYPEGDIGLIQKAYDYANKFHLGQTRQSGEPYIYHPLEVANILAQMKLDLPSIITGILHDVVEDTSTTIEEVEHDFGAEIAQLVDGVTKISQINIKSKAEKQAENFRKMLMAMARDLRVILVKLADRTHNMRTLEYLPSDKQQAIASETLDIYAPIANRLGISWMKIELEDLSLRYLKPEVYYKLAALVSKKKRERDEYIKTLIEILTNKIQEYGLKVKVSGRSKHFYSIYKKMESRDLDFEEIHDLVGFRVLTNSITECYEVLGIVHSFFKPVPGRFKDYIAMPKNNLYQSLHTTVIGPFGERLEIQIRTDDMHRVADAGIAAHWKYKDGKLSAKDYDKFQWLRQLVETQESLKDPNEFIESVKLDLFTGDIYIFTPKGELRELPYGATSIDFAYAIHTDVGNKCVGAKVNGRLVPLKHTLRSGDTVEILTSATQKPNKDWLKFAKTGRAQSKIRAFIKVEERERAQLLGHDLLEKEFRRYGQSLPKFEKSKELANKVAEASFANFEELLIAIGYGKTTADKVINKLLPDLKPVSPETEAKSGGLISEIFSNAKKVFNSSPHRSLIKISGMEDILIRFGRCCNPLPGDEILGFITRGRGVSIHKMNCPKALEWDERRRVDVAWNVAPGTDISRNVRIRVVCSDERGLLNDMSRTISSQGINIKSLNIRVGAQKKAVGIIDIEVRTKQQLAKCIKELEGLNGIISVEQIPS